MQFAEAGTNHGTDAAAHIGKTVLDAIGEISSDDTELITLYYGENISAEEAEEVQEAVREKFPDAEVELNYGGQPVYYYFISAE